jgi:hypothetical protein
MSKTNYKQLHGEPALSLQERKKPFSASSPRQQQCHRVPQRMIFSCNCFKKVEPIKADYFFYDYHRTSASFSKRCGIGEVVTATAANCSTMASRWKRLLNR